MRSRHFYIKFIAIIVILSIAFQFVFTWSKSFAEPTEIPETIRRVTDEAEKEKLLGTTSEEARLESILGLASHFSVFVKENLTLTNSDSEGKIAAGGVITNTANFSYEAGTECKNENEAKIIAGKGLEGAFSLLRTKHTTLTNNSTDETKKIAAIGSETNSMNWSNYQPEEQAHMVVSDLIDFDAEFTYLQNKSEELKNTASNGTVTEGYIMGRRKNLVKAAIFKGNSQVNVFNLTVEQFNNLCNYNYVTHQYHLYYEDDEMPFQENNNIVFDVPKDSYIIVNIIGSGQVYFLSEQGFNNGSVKIPKANIYYARNDEQLAEEKFTYYPNGTYQYIISPVYIKSASDYKGNVYVYAYDDLEEDFFRDNNEAIQTYKSVFNPDTARKDLPEASKLLWNIPDSGSVLVLGNIMGTILAPKANVNEWFDTYGGYLNGSLVARSYRGQRQFGYSPYKEKSNIKISKTQEDGTSISGASMRIKDLSGSVIIDWTTSDKSKLATLEDGKYILEEIQASASYENPTLTETTFVVNKYGVRFGANLKTRNLVKKTFSLGSGDAAKARINNLNNLFSDPNLINALGSNLLRGLEFEIDQSGIDGELYYVVASNGYGVFCIQRGYTPYLSSTDWVEFKKWTNVKEGISANVPVIYKDLYENEGNNVKNCKIHFFKEDGTEITDSVPITNINAVWYELQETPIVTKKADNVAINNIEDTITVTNNHIKTTIEITKQDADVSSVLLKGAEYELQDATGQVLYTFAPTGEDGKTVLTDLLLDAGTYYLVEKTAPEGYELSTEKIELTVKPNTSETISKIITDKKISIPFEKQDEYGNKLAGATLAILNKNNETIKTIQSTNETIAIEGLPIGEYTLREISAPAGYSLADDIKFEITNDYKAKVNNEEINKITMKNIALKGTINVTKLGEVLTQKETIVKLIKYKVYKIIYQEKEIQDATLSLYAKEDIVLNGTKIYSKDEKIATETTSENGVALFKNLPMGNYYVAETNAPEGFELTETKYDVSLIPTLDENKTQTLIAAKDIVNERVKETVKITKTEKGTTTPVKDAIYGLYNETEISGIDANTLLDVVATGTDGIGIFEIDLPMGKYYVKEIEAPAGYELSDEIKSIEFNESNSFDIHVEDKVIEKEPEPEPERDPKQEEKKVEPVQTGDKTYVVAVILIIAMLGVVTTINIKKHN